MFIAKKSEIIKIFLFIIFFSMLFCCSNKAEKKSVLIIGSWSIQKNNVYTIIRFLANGKWHIQIRIEGIHFKIIEKRGQAEGTWTMNEKDKTVTLVTVIGYPEIGWKVGTQTYDIAKLDPLRLHLKNENGIKVKWKKVRGKQGTGSDKNITSVTIAPVVTNISKDRYNQRYSWICADISLILGRDDMMIQIHPKVHEKIIFFLSSKTYRDVNSNSKLQNVRKNLCKLLNLYMDNKILEVVFNKFTVTGRKNAVGEFLEPYKPAEKKSN